MLDAVSSASYHFSGSGSYEIIQSAPQLGLTSYSASAHYADRFSNQMPIDESQNRNTNNILSSEVTQTGQNVPNVLNVSNGLNVLNVPMMTVSPSSNANSAYFTLSPQYQHEYETSLRVGQDWPLTTLTTNVPATASSVLPHEREPDSATVTALAAVNSLASPSRLTEFRMKSPNIILTVAEKLEMLAFYRDALQRGQKPRLSEVSSWAVTRFQLCRPLNNGTISRILNSEESLLKAEHGELFRPNRRSRHSLVTDKMAAMLQEKRALGHPITHECVTQTLHVVCEELEIPLDERPNGGNGFRYGFRRRYGFLYEGNCRRKPESYVQRPRLTTVNRAIKDRAVAK